MHTLSDKELYYLLQGGNHAAFKVVYQRYASRLMQFAYSKTGNLEDSKDCIQEVFVWLWQSGHSIDISDSPKGLEGYLKVAVKNKVINLIEKKVRQDNYSKEAMRTLADELPADLPLTHKELTWLVQEEVSSMPARMRTIFELSREKGLSNKQIATELSLSEQTVKNQLGNAKERLRIKLQQHLAMIL